MNKFLYGTCKRFYAFALAMFMVIGTVIGDGVVNVNAVESGSSTTETHTFDATKLTIAADKEAMTNDQFTDAYFSVTGNVVKRGTAPAVKAVELAKASGGAVTFTVTGTAEVKVGAMSTGTSNTSAIALVDASGNTMVNSEGLSTVSGRTTTEMTYTLSAGTYSVVSPANSSYSRGVQVVYVNVSETITASGESSEESSEATEESSEVTEASSEATEASTEASEASTEVGEETTESSEQGFVEGDLYVSTTGTASGDGSYENPMDLVTAINAITPGHTIWMINGTYKVYEQYAGSIVIPESNSGSAGAYKKISSINNGEVIIDFAGMAEASSNRGIVLDGSYWHFYGLDICNAGDNGMLLSGDNNIIEMCQFYNNHDTGLQLSRYNTNYNTIETWPSNNLIKNCTSFNNKDEATAENADGFAAKLTCGEGNVFDGCIAYCNSDDGWDLYAKTETGSIGVVTIKNCVSFGNGKLTDGTGSANGDMNGFKLGGSGVPTPHVVQNCLAFNNGAVGFVDNNNGGAITLTNCTSANNGVYATKPNYSCNRASADAKYTNLLSYVTSTSASTDIFKGILDNVLYHYKGLKTNESYYWIDTPYTCSDGKQIKYTGSEAASKTVTASDFVTTTIPGYNASASTYGTNYHDIFRDADGSINLNGLYELVENSPLRTAGNNGGIIGATFSKTTSGGESSEPSSESSEATEESTEASEESSEPIISGSAMIHNFTTDDKTSSFYTISGNLSEKGTVTYNGLTLTQCLKIESKTSISFNAEKDGKLVLVFGGSTESAGKSIKIDGIKYTIGSDRTLTLDLAAGSHSITKADYIFLYYMSFTYNGEATEESSETTEESSEATEESSEATEESSEATEESSEATEESSEATEESSETTEESSEQNDAHKHSAEEDDWNYNYASHWHNCDICGKVVDFADHNWSDWAATGNNQMERKCADCGATQAREIPASGIPASGSGTQTSDNSNLIFWVMLLAVCGGALVGIKKSKN